MTMWLVLTIVALLVAMLYVLQPKKEYWCRDCGHCTLTPRVTKPGNAWFTGTLFIIGILFWPIFFAWIGYMVWRSTNAIYHCPSCDGHQMRVGTRPAV